MPFLSNGAPLNIQAPANELYISRDGLLWIASLNGLWKIDHQKGAAEGVGEEDGFLEAGDHQIQWNGESKNGQALPSGIYLVQLRMGVEVINRKVILQRF